MDTRRLWSMWWSGVFALAAGVHLVRTLAHIPVTIGTVAIPMWVSWVVCPIAGVLSAWLARIALEKQQPTPPRPPTMALGDFHPKAAGKDEPQHAGQTSGGTRPGAPEWGNDRPDE